MAVAAAAAPAAFLLALRRAPNTWGQYNTIIRPAQVDSVRTSAAPVKETTNRAPANDNNDGRKGAQCNDDERLPGSQRTLRLQPLHHLSRSRGRGRGCGQGAGTDASSPTDRAAVVAVALGASKDEDEMSVAMVRPDKPREKPTTPADKISNGFFLATCTRLEVLLNEVLVQMLESEP